MVKVESLFDKDTYTMTYVVWDPASNDCLVIDPVRDYDPASSRVSDKAMQRLLALLAEKNLHPKIVLETHAHADHMSGAPLLRQRFSGLRVAIGRHICEVQKTFAQIFGLPKDFPVDGRQFDILLDDNATFAVGSIQVRVLHTPGHTPACSSYLIDDYVFVGDVMFMPDSGTGRCDFPGGSAQALYKSITKRLYQLPDATKVMVGHDYQPNGRALAFQTTIGDAKRRNIQLKADTSEADYIKFRRERDATLTAPRLLLPSIQVNINAGELPASAANGTRYLHIPIFE